MTFYDIFRYCNVLCPHWMWKISEKDLLKLSLHHCYTQVWNLGIELNHYRVPKFFNPSISTINPFDLELPYKLGTSMSRPCIYFSGRFASNPTRGDSSAYLHVKHSLTIRCRSISAVRILPFPSVFVCYYMLLHTVECDRSVSYMLQEGSVDVLDPANRISSEYAGLPSAESKV